MLGPLVAASLFWLLSAPTPSFAADWSTIKIGTEGAFPPWNATNSDGELIGFEIDLAQDLCRRMKVKCDIVTQTWNGMIPALTTGKYDAIMAGMTITDERERMIRFSSCYGNEPATFAVRGDSNLTTAFPEIAKVNLATLEPEDQAALHTLRKGLTDTIIGIQIATAHADFVQQFFDDVAEIQQFDTLENLTLDLDAGRIDAVFLSKAAWKKMIEGEGNLDIAPIGPDIVGGILGKGVGVGMRVEDGDLREMFSAAIAEARADGSISRLSERWFGFDLSC